MLATTTVNFVLLSLALQLLHLTSSSSSLQRNIYAITVIALVMDIVAMHSPGCLGNGIYSDHAHCDDNGCCLDIGQAVGSIAKGKGKARDETPLSESCDGDDMEFLT
ncbi:hypothetical protein BDN71DRAFT_1428288 [Pleurotus eryngii]|uniref:Uncharacterized protein n=1 Tax=Pleurotus eryngii TaxID=5323 RepID=A0A9P6DC27_PLEER|nr:hypothetical protein BDN71DRAFT_1428288 [Pleurotus eryngii]